MICRCLRLKWGRNSQNKLNLPKPHLNLILRTETLAFAIPDKVVSALRQRKSKLVEREPKMAIFRTTSKKVSTGLGERRKDVKQMPSYENRDVQIEIGESGVTRREGNLGSRPQKGDSLRDRFINNITSNMLRAQGLLPQQGCVGSSRWGRRPTCHVNRDFRNCVCNENHPWNQILFLSPLGTLF